MELITACFLVFFIPCHLLSRLLCLSNSIIEKTDIYLLEKPI